MSLEGRIHDGSVVFNQPVSLPEGTRVRIEPVTDQIADSSEGQSLLEELRNAVGSVDNLPTDMAANHDYYLHGHSRKQQPRTARWLGEVSAAELSEQEAADEASQFSSMAAETRGLPPDLSTNHDHYLHGLPKQ